MSFLLENEPGIRLGAFLGVFVAMALWEVLAPRRVLTIDKPRRWRRNLGLVAVNTLLLRIAVPATAIGTAWLAAARGWGLLNLVELPRWLEVVAAVIVLDLVIYLQHVMFHAVPALWKLHVVHHADLDFDVTTGARFHPIEIVLSMIIKIAAVALIGAPALAVLVFEVLLNATAMFNHANVGLPARLDRALRWIVVTPDMHRVHHSVKRVECSSNFGFNLPWWDRILGTYTPQPGAGHAGMVIGVSHIRERRQTLPWLLALPFRTRPGAYSFGDASDRGPGRES